MEEGSVTQHRNGDVEFRKVRQRRRFWRTMALVGGLSVFITLAAFIGMMVYVRLTNSMFAAMGLFFTSWSFSLPSALITGFRARNGWEVGWYTWASFAGVFFAPLLAHQIQLSLMLGVPALLAAIIIGPLIFNARKWNGYQVEPLGDCMSSLHCDRCGYWLCGLSKRRCPECGTPFGRQE